MKEAQPTRSEQILEQIREEMPDAFGRMGLVAGVREWCRQWQLVIEQCRKEAQLACDLRVSQDQVIERCAKAVEEWPDAAKRLREHCGQSEDTAVSGEDFGQLRREIEEMRRYITAQHTKVKTAQDAQCEAEAESQVARLKEIIRGLIGKEDLNQLADDLIQLAPDSGLGNPPRKYPITTTDVWIVAARRALEGE